MCEKEDKNAKEFQISQFYWLFSRDVGVKSVVISGYGHFCCTNVCQSVLHTSAGQSIAVNRVNQTNIGTVSKATLGTLHRDRVERI